MRVNDLLETFVYKHTTDIFIFDWKSDCDDTIWEWSCCDGDYEVPKDIAKSKVKCWSTETDPVPHIIIAVE